ncbi:MAG: YdjY domain-containing protein [Planctomycetota bacterium]|nr:YdjY domain-containing protein [Planctomycetota bacterium]
MRHAITVAALLLLAVAAPAGEVPVIKTLPGIVVDTKAREVRLEGEVCLQRGGLELLACSPGTREHESVIVVKAKPSHIVFALALLDLAPGQPGYMTAAGSFSPPGGTVVEVAARWTVAKPDGKTETVEVPAWKLLKLGGSESGLERPVQWVYVGRPSEQALRAADQEGTVVCLSNFTEAVLDVPFESTSVNAELLYEANPAVVPPVKTPVELILRPTSERKGRPPVLDGKPKDMPALRDALNAMPADVRTAVLKAEADESVGRFMQVYDVLRDALMKVHPMLLAPKAAGPAAAQPLAVTIAADGKVRIGEQTLTLEEFRAKAGTLLMGAEKVAISAEKSADQKIVAEVLDIAREQGVNAVISHGETTTEKK